MNSKIIFSLAVSSLICISCAQSLDTEAIEAKSPTPSTTSATSLASDAPDTISFSPADFTPLSEQNLSTRVESNAITYTGTNPKTISISGEGSPLLSVKGGA